MQWRVNLKKKQRKLEIIIVRNIFNKQTEQGLILKPKDVIAEPPHPTPFFLNKGRVPGEVITPRSQAVVTEAQVPCPQRTALSAGLL